TLGQDCEHILRVASRKAVHEKLTIAISAKARVLITASTSMAGNRAAAQPAIAVAGAAQGAQGCRVAVPIRIVRRPKSPHWIMRGTLRGIRLEESTGTDDKRAAEEIRAKREAEILAESVYGRRVTATFASAALSYLENGGSKRFLEPVIKHFGTTP